MREQRVFYLTNSHRFGPNIAHEVQRYVTGVMEPLELADFMYRMRNRNGAVPQYVFPPPLVGSSSFQGVIHDSRSPPLAFPYTHLCRTNKGVLMAALQTLGLMCMLSQPSQSTSQSQSQSAESASPTSTRASSNVNIEFRNLKIYVLGGYSSSLNKMVGKVEELLKLAIEGREMKYSGAKYTSFDKLVEAAEEEENAAMQYYCEFVKMLRAVEGLDIPSIMQKLRACEVKNECDAHVVIGTIYTRRKG